MFRSIASRIGRLFSSTPVVLPPMAQGMAEFTVRNMLADERFTWRSLYRMAKAIRWSQSDTVELLASIGARQSRNGKPVYTNKR